MKRGKIMRTKLLLVTVSALAGALVVLGCTIDEPCDPGQVVEVGLCITPMPDDPAGGAGGATAPEEEKPNFDADCAEMSECLAGTVCGAPDLPKCIGLCGPDDPFEDNCPSDKSCTEVRPGTSICF